MGTIIKIDGASFADYFDSEIVFDKLANDIVTATFLSGVVTIKHDGLSSRYETAASSEITNITFTTPTTGQITVNAICIGVLTDGSFAILYLNGSTAGDVLSFGKDGSIGVTKYTTTGTPPNAVKGTPVTIEIKSDRITYSYTGFSADVLFSAITDFDSPIIGFLATTNNDNVYDMTIN